MKWMAINHERLACQRRLWNGNTAHKFEHTKLYLMNTIIARPTVSCLKSEMLQMICRLANIATFHSNLKHDFFRWPNPLSFPYYGWVHKNLGWCQVSKRQCPGMIRVPVAPRIYNQYLSSASSVRAPLGGNESRDVARRNRCHDDVMARLHDWPFVRGIQRSPGIVLTKGQLWCLVVCLKLLNKNSNCPWRQCIGKIHPRYQE